MKKACEFYFTDKVEKNHFLYYHFRLYKSPEIINKLNILEKITCIDNLTSYAHNLKLVDRYSVPFFSESSKS